LSYTCIAVKFAIGSISCAYVSKLSLNIFIAKMKYLVPICTCTNCIAEGTCVFVMYVEKQYQ